MTNLVNNFKIIFSSPRFYVALIVALILVVIGYIMPGWFQEKMTSFYFNIGSSRFDLWSLSHVLLYIYFGYYFPNFFVEFLIIGVFWESFENTFCSASFLRLINCPLSGNDISNNNMSKQELKLQYIRSGSKNKINNTNLLCKGLGKINNCGYWYGKLEDIPCNMLGFVIGAWLAKKYHPINNK